MASHYLPAFTVTHNDGSQQAVCGQFVYDSDHTPIPSCLACATWLASLESLTHEPARVLATITPTEPWGATP